MMIVEIPPRLPVIGVDPPVEAGRCRVQLTLEAVLYGGDDIGSRWRLRASFAGGTWDPGPLVLHHGDVLPVNHTVHDGLLGTCGALHVEMLSAGAVERSGWCHDRGRMSWPLLISCRNTPERRRFLLTLFVPECRYLGRSNRVAVLLFVVRVTSVCS